MRIGHIAIWTNNLEELLEFYITYFQATASDKYVNPIKQFESYFLTFPAGAVRLELMRKPGLRESPHETGAQAIGYTHLAFSVGSEEQVDALTARMQKLGIPLVDGPRYTGDGYYESCVLDPDSNRVEITI
jgi:lactoylglutathione lyase